MPTPPGRNPGDDSSPDITEDASIRSAKEDDSSHLSEYGTSKAAKASQVQSPESVDVVSPTSDVEESSLLGEIVRTLERNNPGGLSPLNMRKSTTTTTKKGDLRIPLENVTFIDPPKLKAQSKAKNGKAKTPEEKGKTTPGSSAKTPPSITSAKTPSDGSRTPGKVTVKPFTKESLERLETKTVQLVKEYGFQPRRKLSVEDGARLPFKFEPFPQNLYGRPLEEIDNFIYDEVSQHKISLINEQ